MAVVTQTMVNGVNVGQLLETISAIKEDPKLAGFQFRARTNWLGGGHSRTTIQGYATTCSEPLQCSTLSETLFP